MEVDPLQSLSCRLNKVKKIKYDICRNNKCQIFKKSNKKRENSRNEYKLDILEGLDISEQNLNGLRKLKK